MMPRCSGYINGHPPPTHLAGLLPAETFESSHQTIDIRIIVEYDLNIKKSIGNGEAADTPGGRHPHEEDSMALTSSPRLKAGGFPLGKESEMSSITLLDANGPYGPSPRAWGA